MIKASPNSYLYVQSALSIKPKSKHSKIDSLKTIIEAWGLDPNAIQSREALARSLLFKGNANRF